jgi:excisionase family DNA binding protein
MNDRLAFSVSECAAAIGISRSKLYEEIKEGRIQCVHIGKRTVITVDEAQAFLRRLADEQRQAAQPDVFGRRPLDAA